MFSFPEHYENFFWENTKKFFREVLFRKNCRNFFKEKSWELRLESARGRPIIRCNRQYQFHFPFSSNFLRENFVRTPCFLSSAYWFSLNIPGKTFSWIPSICSTIWEEVDGTSSLATQYKNVYIFWVLTVLIYILFTRCISQVPLLNTFSFLFPQAFYLSTSSLFSLNLSTSPLVINFIVTYQFYLRLFRTLNFLTA